MEIELDDAGGRIELSPTDTPIEAGASVGRTARRPPRAAAQFSGKVDKVTTTISRGGGLILTISAESADEKS